MRLTKAILLILCAIIALLLAGCDQPEYMNPYGEGVDPNSVTTGAFQSRTTMRMTDLPLLTTTTTSPVTRPTAADVYVPDGYRLCPECNGIKIACGNCEGTGQVFVSTYDVDSGVYSQVYEDCDVCTDHDPGFYVCEECHNELIVPE